MYKHFSQALPLTPHSDTYLIFRNCLEKAQHHMPAAGGSGHLPQDIGVFLVQSLCFLDFVADDLVEGRHMRVHTRSALGQLENENDLSELDSLESLMETHAILRKICKRIHEASKEIRLLWNEAATEIPVETGWVDLGAESVSTGPSIPSRPSEDMRVEPHTDLDAQTFPPMGVQPQEIHQYDEPLATATADLPQSDACDADQSAETLNNRGTGHYTCAYGMSCTKGGVLSGQMVVFTRNSDIRAHIEKHSRPYKCNLPNCPTRKGFSRSDQLRRHQNTVSHEAMS